jgi:hypothetical protein
MGLSNNLGKLSNMITSTGSAVGIGTTSPVAKLNVYGTSGNPSMTADTNNLFSITGSLGPQLNIGGYNGASYGMWLQVKDAGNTNINYPILLQPLGGAVGIGTSSPSYKFHVSNNTNGFISRFTGGTSSDVNIGIFGSTAGAFGSIGTESNHPFNIFTNGTDRMTIMSGGDVGVGSTGIATVRLSVFGAGTTSSAYSFISYDSGGNVLLMARNDGLIMTGTRVQSPYNLTIAASANCFIYSDGALFRATSSARYKKDIEDLNVDTFGLINKIRPVWYRSTTGNDREDWSWYGFIAEELAEVDKRFVQYGYAPEDYINDEESNKPKLKEGAELRADGVMYDRLTVLLIKGMQEQNQIIQELNERLNKAGL